MNTDTVIGKVEKPEMTLADVLKGYGINPLEPCEVVEFIKHNEAAANIIVSE